MDMIPWEREKPYGFVKSSVLSNKDLSHEIILIDKYKFLFCHFWFVDIAKKMVTNQKQYWLYYFMLYQEETRSFLFVIFQSKTPEHGFG